MSYMIRASIWARLLSSVGSALVGFLQSGAGAVLRTVQEKAREVPSSADFGLVAGGAGQVGDGAKLNALFAAGAGRRVVILPGSYNCGAVPLVVPANTVVDADGARLYFSGQVKGVSLGGGAIWRGGEVAGPSGAVYGATGYGFFSAGVENAGAAPTYISGPKVLGVKVSGWNFAGVWLEYCNGAEVRGCEIFNCGYVGAAGISCLQSRIDENVIVSIKGTGAPDTYGAFFSAKEGTETQNPRSWNCSISHNKIRDVPNWEAIDVHGDIDIDIIGNRIEGCRFGIACVSGDTNGVESRGPKRVNIKNNTISAGSDGAAIIVKGAPIERAEDIDVSGNTIINGGRTSDNAEGSIRVYDVNRISIVGNKVRGAWVYGLNLIQNIGGAIVTGNIFDGWGDATQSFPAGVAVTSNNVEATISDNTFKATATGRTFENVNSVVVSGGVTGLNVLIGRNHMIGTAAGKLGLSAVNPGAVYAGVEVQNGNATTAANTATVVFPRRFSTVPKVFASPTTAGNIRVSAVSETQATFDSTQAITNFYWSAEV